MKYVIRFSFVLLFILFTLTPFVSVQAQSSAECQASLSTTMQYGVRSGEVLELQKFLVTKDLLGDESTSGYFGPLTKAAVISFQSSNGLTADGVVGAATRARINAMCGGTSSANIISQTASSTNGGSNANVNLIATDLGGGAFNLSWTSSGVTSCTSNDFYISPGPSSIAGSMPVSVSVTTTFSIACVHSRGIAEDQATAYVSSNSTGTAGTGTPSGSIPPTTSLPPTHTTNPQITTSVAKTNFYFGMWPQVSVVSTGSTFQVAVDAAVGDSNVNSNFYTPAGKTFGSQLQFFNQSVQWSSTNPQVATVSDNAGGGNIYGTVTAVGPGTATIVAKIVKPAIEVGQGFSWAAIYDGTVFNTCTMVSCSYVKKISPSAGVKGVEVSMNVTVSAPATSQFKIGDKVVTNGLNVNTRPTAGSTLSRGLHNTGDKGTIISGPSTTTVNGVNIVWWEVDYATGVDGWNSGAFLLLDTAANTNTNSNLPATGKYKAGDRVAVSGSNANTRDSAATSGALLGVHVIGDRGVVASGPVTADGYTWWYVNFNSGADGWVVEPYLVADGANTGEVVTTSPDSKIYSFTASPSTITSGQTTTLSWSADAHTCGVYDGTTGSMANVGGSSIGSFDPATAINGMFPAIAGSVVISPVSTWTYTIKCNKTIGGGGQGGSPVPTDYVTQTVTVTVNEGTAPTISSFTATPVGAAPVKTINLAWTTNATSCRLEQQTDTLGGNMSISGVNQVIWTGAGGGSIQANPLSSGVFVLICKKDNKTTVKSLPVTVEYTNNDPTTLSIRSELSNPVNNPVTADVKINGGDGIVTTKAGVPFTYSWNSSNAQMCYQSDPGMSGLTPSGGGTWTKNLYTLPSPGQWHLDVNNAITITITCRGRNGPYIEGQYNYISSSDTVMVKLVP